MSKRRMPKIHKWVTSTSVTGHAVTKCGWFTNVDTLPVQDDVITNRCARCYPKGK
jgi:hypothetical protein